MRQQRKVKELVDRYYELSSEMEQVKTEIEEIFKKNAGDEPTLIEATAGKASWDFRTVRGRVGDVKKVYKALGKEVFFSVATVPLTVLRGLLKSKGLEAADYIISGGKSDSPKLKLEKVNGEHKDKDWQ